MIKKETMSNNVYSAAQYRYEEGSFASRVVDSHRDSASRDIAEDLAYEHSHSPSNNVAVVVAVNTEEEVAHNKQSHSHAHKSFTRKRIDGTPSLTPSPSPGYTVVNNAVSALNNLSLEDEGEAATIVHGSNAALIQHHHQSCYTTSNNVVAEASQQQPHYVVTTTAPIPYPHFNRFPISAPMATRGSFSYNSKSGRKNIVTSQTSSLEHSVSKDSLISTSEGSDSASVDGYGDREVCRYFLRTGMCGYGDKCRYLHPKTAPKPNLNAVGYPMRDGEHACPFYMKNGWCGFGVTCKFNHPEVATVAPQHLAPIPGALPPPPPPPVPAHPTTATVTTAPAAIATVPYPVAAPAGGAMNYAMHHVHPHTMTMPQHSIYYPINHPSTTHPHHPHLHPQGPTTEIYAMSTAPPPQPVPMARSAQVAPMAGYVPHYVSVSSVMNHHSWPMNRMEQHNMTNGNNALVSIDAQQQESYSPRHVEGVTTGNMTNAYNNVHYNNQNYHVVRGNAGGGEMKQYQNYQMHYETMERSKSVGEGLVNISSSSSDGGHHHHSDVKYKGVNVSHQQQQQHKQKEYVMAASEGVSAKKPLSQSSNASTSVAIN